MFFISYDTMPGHINGLLLFMRILAICSKYGKPYILGNIPTLLLNHHSYNSSYIAILVSNNERLSLCVLLFLSQERSPGDVQAYNNIIIHETLRVAVCNNLDGQHKFPSKLL